MKRKLIMLSVLLVLVMQQVFSQQILIQEDFDGNVSYTSIPQSSWRSNTSYYLPSLTGSATSSSYLGLVPNKVGDTTFLESIPYNFSGKWYVLLQFNHICKVSPNDQTLIQYRIGSGSWQTVDAMWYSGNATNYLSTGFNAASYSQWDANNIAVLPGQDWWKEENFDMSFHIGNEIAQIRFVIIHGSVPNTQASFGWLLENIQITASPYPVSDPIVAFITPFVKDTVYSAGPWEINAKVKTTTTIAIKQPYLKYVATNNGVHIKTDSILMENVSGDSLWKAIIPQFETGTTVDYFIIGKDTTGNEATISSSYHIKRISNNVSGELIIGTGTGSSFYEPYCASFHRGWSRSIYMDWEFDPLGQGALIREVAYYSARAGSSNLENLTMYFKAVEDSIIDPGLNYFIDPIADGATLVWGTATNSTSGISWVTFVLHEPFLLLPGKNLMIYWTNQDGNSADNGGTTLRWQYTTVENKNIRSYGDGAWPTTENIAINSNRPNVKFYLVDNSLLDNSASMHSIDINDTTVTASNYQTPIVVTVKNKGDLPLDSVTVSFAINGGVPKDTVVHFNPALPWDFNEQIRVGDYMQRVNASDTITAWVSLPNSQYDPTIWDDTLTKVVYGTSDLKMKFVEHVTGTAYDVGPYKTTSRIESITGEQINNVSLFVEYRKDATVEYDTLPMVFNTTTGLWEGTIPQTQAGNNITYKLILNDFLGNTVTVADSFYINVASTSYVIVGTGTSTRYFTPMNTFAYYSWSRELYLGTELSPTDEGGIITKLAWDYAYTGTWNFTNQTCYIKAVDDTYLTSNGYVDPVTDGATLVWQGSIGASKPGWAEIELDTPFELPAGKNLMIYWNHEHGSNAGSSLYTFNHHSTMDNMAAYGYHDMEFHMAKIGPFSANYSTYRPNVRFFVLEEIKNNNSASVCAINSPSSGVVTANVQVPVIVTIRNEGLDVLSSCKIQWTKNGTLQTSLFPGSIYTLTTPIPTHFTDTVVVGYYTPNTGDMDNIAVWVELPNTIVDLVSHDDTVMISTVACDGALEREYTVGSYSADYIDVASALFQLAQCGISGKVTLKLEDGTYAQDIDLSPLNGLLTNSDTLEITSLSGSAANVTLKPLSSHPMFLFSSMENIIINALTIDATAGNSHVFEFTGPCANIAVTNCMILLDTIRKNAFHKITATGTLNGLTVTNCTVSGGSYAVNFSLEAADRPNITNLVFDHNVFSGQYNMGVLLENANPKSISYNKITSRSTNTEKTWYGMSINQSRFMPPSSIVGNSIYSNNAAITTSLYGIRTYFNDSVLVANNEIHLNSSASTTYGIHIGNAKVSEYVYNTVLLTGTGGSTFNALYWSTIGNTTYNATVSHNILIANGGVNPYAIYLSADIVAFQSNYRISDNNYYSSGNLGYHDVIQSDLNAWKSSITMDVNSINIMPSFIDYTSSLRLANYQELLFPLYSGISTDITGAKRPSLSSIGAYSQSTTGTDVMLLQVNSWEEEVVEEQVVDISLNVFNSGSVPVNRIVFGWSLNGQLQNPVTHTISPSLAPSEDLNILVESFPVTGTDRFDVIVWIDTVNTAKDVNQRNDSAFVSTTARPLVEFVAPFVKDTIYGLTFDVNAVIRTQSGAPVSPPELNLTTTVTGYHTFTSSVPMTLTDGIWQVTIPRQYYGSKVIYSLTVSDLFGNTVTLVDSTYLKFEPDRKDTVTIGTGTTTVDNNPYNYYYTWSRNYYMDYEIDPGKRGGYINSIAFYNASPFASAVNNVSLYLKAVPDSTVSSGYVNPFVDGATLVWGPAVATMPGTDWMTFSLSTPFYLPRDMNLLVYVDNQSGVSGSNGPSWQSTTQNKPMSIYEYDPSSFPSSLSGIQTIVRPNIQIDLSADAEYYSGYDLAILSMVEPVNTGSLCSPNYTPVKIAVSNLGENKYNFVQNPIEVGIEISDPVGHYYHYTNIIYTGELAPGETAPVEFMSALPIMYSGTYGIKAWVNSPIDNISYDDTLKTQFISGRIALPIRENFSNTTELPAEFISYVVDGTAKWKIVSNPSSAVQPDSGTAMVYFPGTVSSVATLSTRQLDLYQSFNPFVEFWYYHDSNTSTNDYSYTDVDVVVDGVVHNLITLYLRDINGNHGWTRYRYPLNQFTANSACVLIQFEAMNKYPGTAQYIDYIQISSEEDAAVSEIIISPDPDLCNHSGYDVSVVIAAARNQSITFDDNASILLDLDGTIYPVSLQGKVLHGNSSDTIPVLSNTIIPTGSTAMKAYFGSKVDNVPANDTAERDILINPNYTIRIHSTSNDGSPALADIDIKQEVTIKNTGNMPLPQLNLILSVDAEDVSPAYHFTTTASSPNTLAPGDSVTIAFNSLYTTPWSPEYQVHVLAYLHCDSALISKEAAITEYVDISNLVLINIDKPSGQMDAVDANINIEVSLENKSDATPFANVGIHARVEDSKGNIVANLSETISKTINTLSPASHVFSSSYTVPADSVYYITVFIDKQAKDNYQHDDTIRIKRTTDYNLGIESIPLSTISMSQNVPNPANDHTSIIYSIPANGEVTFTISSINGQVLYNKSIKSELGMQTIDINVSHLAAGIYFYSMEFHGQRITKRMSIKR